MQPGGRLAGTVPRGSGHLSEPYGPTGDEDHGLKIEPGEEDGCEERCCPGFWNDDGVPRGVPVLEWVFDPNNKLLNENECARRFGDIGHPYADKKRKTLFGFGIAVT